MEYCDIYTGMSKSIVSRLDNDMQARRPGGGGWGCMCQFDINQVI